MTKGELIRALEPFEDNIPITIFKNGTVFLAEAFYGVRNGDGLIVLHNFKPETIYKLVQLVG